jgi:hypothetical protein
MSDLVAIIDADRQHGNLSSAIRLFVLGVYLDQISAHDGRIHALSRAACQIELLRHRSPHEFEVRMREVSDRHCVTALTSARE